MPWLFENLWLSAVPHQGHQGTTAPLRARLDISRRHKNPCRCGLVLPQESVRWMVEWVNGLWFQWTKWIYVSFQYVSFISMEFNGLMLWPWRHGNGHRPIVLPTAEAELCRQRDATKAWRSCAAEGSCSIAQQRQQALRRGCPWEKHGKTWGKTMWLFNLLFTFIWQEKWWVWECKWLWRICYMV